MRRLPDPHGERVCGWGIRGHCGKIAGLSAGIAEKLPVLP